MRTDNFTKKELLGARIEWRGEHKGFRYVIACTPREPSAYLEYDKAWCSYVLLTPAQHEEYKDYLNDAPWNYGQTYYRKHTEEFVDASPEMQARFNGSWFKMGDDFQHLWDDGKHDLYDLNYMRRHIERVIDFIASKSKEVGE